ncbi:PIR Superfamily Protein [Plasmodium ovale wallikeri]|uniref:PIR Superfamily Protein n=2 Tax=Plasmodium ovale TaxID=36330 RepID=A0A1A9AP40_PLAOA|nr:PIR Superfamily Protein [Plasmodium ovale wallikeri]SBT57962.1 PIR Superfamily Protein [Plasmodium ovale wallikeri]SBT78585.1 Plasmodium vivax Vir protein, putative [Plasmodium ovale]
MSSINPDIYSFFVNFTNYKDYEKEMEAKYSQDKGNTTCDTYSGDSVQFGNDSANNICVKFKILRNVILSRKRPKTELLDDKDFAYLNYWLNSISRNTTISNNLTVDELQRKMSFIEKEFFFEDFDEKLYDMNDEEFHKTNLLYELKINYGEIFLDSKKMLQGNTPCIGYIQKYINTYKKCIIQCPDDDTNFCKALTHFKEEFAKNILGTVGIAEQCPDKDLLRLPTYSEASLERRNTIIGSVLGPSFGTLCTILFLYKFTPFRQWIHAKIGRNNEAQNNLNEENIQPLFDNSDNEYINFDGSPYDISYYPSVNS